MGTQAGGHRDRLRKKLQKDPGSLGETERLELLLTYAIPRKDVSLLAKELLARFGSLRGVIFASAGQLFEINGLGESTAVFLQLIQSLISDIPSNSLLEQEDSILNMPSKTQNHDMAQLQLFGAETADPQPTVHPQMEVPKERSMRAFVNDEVANSLAFLPKAPSFQSLEEFKKYLAERLPYNAAETRRRRANYIVERFFPCNTIRTPLADFLSHNRSEASLKPVVFYHILKAEPVAARIAEELIWPALPTGSVEREQVRELVLGYLPEASDSSLWNMLRALFYTYDLLGTGSAQDKTLRFQLHQGTLESFLYILTSEYPSPGMYSFESLYQGPVHRWMLWDREWIRDQLYNMRDLGIISKISEIDSVRQFTLANDQQTALNRFYEYPERERPALRERIEEDSRPTED